MDRMAESIFIISEGNVNLDSDSIDSFLVSPTTIWVCVGASDLYAETGTKVAGAMKIIEGTARSMGIEVE